MEPTHTLEVKFDFKSSIDKINIIFEQFSVLEVKNFDLDKLSISLEFS